MVQLWILIIVAVVFHQPQCTTQYVFGPLSAISESKANRKSLIMETRSDANSDLIGSDRIPESSLLSAVRTSDGTTSTQTDSLQERWTQQRPHYREGIQSIQQTSGYLPWDIEIPHGQPEGSVQSPNEPVGFLPWAMEEPQRPDAPYPWELEMQQREQEGSVQCPEENPELLPWKIENEQSQLQEYMQTSQSPSHFHPFEGETQQVKPEHTDTQISPQNRLWSLLWDLENQTEPVQGDNEVSQRPDLGDDVTRQQIPQGGIVYSDKSSSGSFQREQVQRPQSARTPLRPAPSQERGTEMQVEKVQLVELPPQVSREQGRSRTRPSPQGSLTRQRPSINEERVTQVEAERVPLSEMPQYFPADERNLFWQPRHSYHYWSVPHIPPSRHAYSTNFFPSFSFYNTRPGYYKRHIAPDVPTHRRSRRQAGGTLRPPRLSNARGFVFPNDSDTSYKEQYNPPRRGRPNPKRFQGVPRPDWFEPNGQSQRVDTSMIFENPSQFHRHPLPLDRDTPFSRPLRPQTRPHPLASDFSSDWQPPSGNSIMHRPFHHEQQSLRWSAPPPATSPTLHSSPPAIRPTTNSSPPDISAPWLMPDSRQTASPPIAPSRPMAGPRLDVASPPNAESSTTAPRPLKTAPPPPAAVPWNGIPVPGCNCLSTYEFNPVCGTDGVTYANPGKMKCAIRCGKSVEILHHGTCINL